MANQNQEGTGKHGHKDTQEPYPHHGQGGGSESRGGQETSGHQGRGGGETSGNEQESLKEREYRDAQGNVHHHTKTFEEQHGKK